MKVAVCVPVGPGHEGEVDSLTEAVAASGLEDYELLFYYDKKGRFGRSKARNLLTLLATAAKADWILWHDADDRLIEGSLGNDALDDLLQDRDAVWGTIFSSGKAREKQLYPDTYRELIESEPYLTLQVGFFVKTQLARTIKWDESMDAGEDFKMYLELWRDHKCRKVPHAWYHNITHNHSTGPRSANGGQWRRAVEDLLGTARASLS